MDKSPNGTLRPRYLIYDVMQFEVSLRLFVKWVWLVIFFSFYRRIKTLPSVITRPGFFVLTESSLNPEKKL